VKKQVIALAALLLATPAAFADTETHSVNYTYSLETNGDNYPRLRLPGFDDMSGQRTLTRVDVRVQSDISATIAIENMTNAPLSGWTLDGQHLVLAGFERENPQTFGPFAFMGGLFIEPITGTLQPTDGTPGSGPDYLATPSSTTIDSTLDMDSSYLDFLQRRRGGDRGGRAVHRVLPRWRDVVRPGPHDRRCDGHVHRPRAGRHVQRDLHVHGRPRARRRGDARRGCGPDGPVPPSAPPLMPPGRAAGSRRYG
jgi:hypothetical protein